MFSIFYSSTRKIYIKYKKIALNHLSKIAVLVPPKYWCNIKFMNKNSILMVACDHEYDVNDYIKNFIDYKKYLGKKWKF